MSGHSLLVYARRTAGLTQDALARLAGTSQPTLSAYERGTKSPSLAVAERIIEATGHARGVDGDAVSGHAYGVGERDADHDAVCAG